MLAAVTASIPDVALADDATQAPSAGDIQLAEQRAAQAFEAYQKKDYTTAVALYLEAYKAASSADMLYNIARIYDTKLGDRQQAITFYRRYVAHPGASAERIKRCNERLADLREAEIAAAERAPKESRAGREARSTSSAESGDRDSTLPQLGLILGAVGVIGVGIGAGFGLAAMSEAHTAKNSCNGNACTTQEGVDAASNASKKATISTIGFAAGGTLLGAGAAFLLWGGRKPSERESGSRLRWGAVATSSQFDVEVSATW
jgi:tetratricopeptide (TPR) repeat protein